MECYYTAQIGFDDKKERPPAYTKSNVEGAQKDAKELHKWGDWLHMKMMYRAAPKVTSVETKNLFWRGRGLLSTTRAHSLWHHYSTTGMTDSTDMIHRAWQEQRLLIIPQS